jgi:hypothetical protein
MKIVNVLELKIFEDCFIAYRVQKTFVELQVTHPYLFKSFKTDKI